MATKDFEIRRTNLIFEIRRRNLKWTWVRILDIAEAESSFPVKDEPPIRSQHAISGHREFGAWEERNSGGGTNDGKPHVQKYADKPKRVYFIKLHMWANLQAMMTIHCRKSARTKIYSFLEQVSWSLLIDINFIWKRRNDLITLWNKVHSCT